MSLEIMRSPSLNLFSDDLPSEAFTQSFSESVTPSLTRPEYKPRVMDDRWYQRQALAECLRRIPKGAKRRDNKGEMLKAPVGSGKTRIATEFIGQKLNWGEKGLFLVDLNRLLEQTYEELSAEGIYPIVEQAERSALSSFPRDGKMVLASMQTLYTGRLQKWAPDAFDFIVIDEAHEMKWPRITNHFTAPYLGLSATPVDEKGRALKQLFHFPYINTLSLREGMEGWNGETKQYEAPYLSRVFLSQIDARHIDLSNVRIVEKGLHAGEFDQDELAEAILHDTNFIATGIKQKTEGMPTWVFAPRCDVVDAISEALRDMNVPAAAYHSKSDTPPEILMKRFKARELTHLVSVNMLIKGINVPMVEAIVRVRRGLSLRQCEQEMGRGTRNSPETGKKRCLVVQFEFNTGKRKLASVLDAILDGAYESDEEVSEEVKLHRAKVSRRTEQLVNEGLQDIIEARKKAEAEIAAGEERERKRKAKEREKYQELQLTIHSEDYDPCDGNNKVGRSGGGAAPKVERPTIEMMQDLERLSGGAHKVEHLNKWTLQSCADRIKKMENKAIYNPNGTTERQVRLLSECFGYSSSKADRMNKWEASKTIEMEITKMRDNLEIAGEDMVTIQTLSPWALAKLHRRVMGV